METQYQNEVKSPKGQHYQGVVTKRRRLNFVTTAPMQVLSGHCGQRWITTDQQDAWSSCLLHPRVRDSSNEGPVDYNGASSWLHALSHTSESLSGPCDHGRGDLRRSTPSCDRERESVKQPGSWTSGPGEHMSWAAASCRSASDYFGAQL